MAPPPELADDIVREILLRIPPDDPAHLLLASLVCKPWRRLLTDPAFLRRYRAFHRTPPLLGFFRTSRSRRFHTDLEFVPTSTFRPRDSKHRNCCMLDCRHGRALLFDHTTRRLLVWDPITGEDHHIPKHFGTDFYDHNAAVLCAAAADCDHLGCHGGPFLVVLVATSRPHDADGEFAINPWVYSSEAGEWSRRNNQEVGGYPCIIADRPPVLTGDKIINFVCEFRGAISRYDLRSDRGLSVIPGPVPTISGSIVLVPAEDGHLRMAYVEDSKIVLWSLETMGPDGVAAWTRLGVIHFSPEFRMSDFVRPGKPSLSLIGVANGPAGDVVFVSTDAGVLAVELESHKVRKVDDIDLGDEFGTIFPYMSFVTPECAVERLSLPLQ